MSELFHPDETQKLTPDAVSFLSQHPHLSHLAHHVLDRAASPTFQEKIPLLADLLAEGAHPHHHHQHKHKHQHQHHHHGHDDGHHSSHPKHDAATHGSKPHVAAYELIRRAWARIFRRLEKDPHAASYLSMTDAAFTRHFGELMTNMPRVEEMKAGRGR